MCKWGNTITLDNPNPESTSNTMDIDECIVPIVQILNDAGMYTVASCCGHGKIPGNIALKDGRELVIMPDFETSRKLEKGFIGV